MSANPTPGPWIAHEGWAAHAQDEEAYAAIREEHPHWCEVTGPPAPNGHDLSVSGHFGIANARLIAAAPDLFAALIRARSYIERAPEHTPAAKSALLGIIDSAITKARGEA